MRKITTQASRAFTNGNSYKNNNTEVFKDSAGTWMELHHHRIAQMGDNGIEITNAGWMTATTKERLNGIDGVHIRQSKGVWYLNGREWGGEWVTVSEWDKNTSKCQIIECKNMVDNTKTHYCSKHLI